MVDHVKDCILFLLKSIYFVCNGLFFRPCCHHCQSQSENDRNYLINVAGTLDNGAEHLRNDFNIQVRFEFGHRLGALVEEPGINIGVIKGCVVRNASSE